MCAEGHTDTDFVAASRYRIRHNAVDAEAGHKEFEYEIWFGMLAPVKTPKETISQLSGWFVAAMQVPEVKAKLVVQGLYPVGKCGADFAADLRRQYGDYGRVIREANIKAE